MCHLWQRKQERYSMTFPRTDGCPSASQTRNLPVDAVPVKANLMNFGAETAPTGGRCWKHSFFQKRDDAGTAAAEAQRGRGRERTLLWYCIKVLEQKPVSHSSAVVCSGTFIQRCVRGGKKRWSVICRDEKFHLLLAVALWFCTSHQCSFFLMSSWIP